MKKSYLGYYKKYSFIGALHFIWDALFIQNNRRKLSYLNRQKDYVELLDKPDLLALHLSLNQYLLNGKDSWHSYDYGEGYFYQSFKKISIRGFRNTEERVEAMKLQELLAEKKVLEIGCNTGFLTLSIAGYCKSIVGFDPAEHLIAIARKVAAYINVSNVTFRVSTFENFQSDERYGAVVSFANHSTFDGNTNQSLSSYFDMCSNFLVPGGLFLFESHPPEHEKDQLSLIWNLIAERFEIHTTEILEYGSFLDRNRTYIVATKKI